jgi:hypothetical protein
MLDRLRRFFWSDDPEVELIRGLLEPEAEMWREALRNSGIGATTKVRDAASRYGMLATGIDTAIYVRKSDLERAQDVLGLEE